MKSPQSQGEGRMRLMGRALRKHRVSKVIATLLGVVLLGGMVRVL